MNQSLVSVVIPTYSRPDNITRAIDSVLAQTYKNVEIIVVDDNGVGTPYQLDTERVLEDYIKQGKVSYLKHEVNKNGSAARNTGIYASKGDFIALLDDDDSFYKDKLNKQVEYLQKNKEYDAAYCYITTKGVVAKSSGKEGNLAPDVLLMTCFLQTSTLLFRREALLDIQGFDETFIRHQDYEMLLRFFKKGHQIGCVKEVLAVYGDNKGMNVPNGEKLERIKDKYLQTFDDYIRELDKCRFCFHSTVYAIHYMQVFICYAKERKYRRAVRIWAKYLILRPDVFLFFFLKKLIFRYRVCRERG